VKGTNVFSFFVWEGSGLLNDGSVKALAVGLTGEIWTKLGGKYLDAVPPASRLPYLTDNRGEFSTGLVTANLPEEEHGQVSVYIRAGDTTQPFLLHGTAVVTDKDLSDPRLPPPRAGGSPARALGGTPSDQWTVESVTWAEADGSSVTGAFQPNTAYQAEVKLKAKPGYTFTGVGANSFTHSGALDPKEMDPKDAPNPANAAGSGTDITVTVRFKTGQITIPPTDKNVVTHLNLSRRVRWPAAVGNWENQWSKEDGEQYQVTNVKWSDEDSDLTSDAKFQAGKKYKAEATLMAKAGWTFEGADDFTYRGKEGEYDTDTNVEHVTVTTEVKLEGTTATVTIVFPTLPEGTHTITEFSNSSTSGPTDNSAIDLIKAAKDKLSVHIGLGTGTETVVPSDTDSDISGGLVLDSSNSPANVVIDGGGRTVQLGTNNGSILTVGSGVKLTLRNITLKGKADNSAQALIYVDGNGAELVLETGAVITDNGRVSDLGAGGVEVKNGTLTMKTGSRVGKNPKGSAVFVTGGTAVFNMEGGIIEGNTTDEGEGYGGVMVFDSGTFNMRGGTIRNNTSGVSIDGKSRFNMYGGTISGSTTYGGVEVVSNEAANHPVFNMYGGTISGNRATFGGGVNVSDGTFTMYDGTISGNTSTSGGGGGVGVWKYPGYGQTDGVFTMKGGTISDNKAASYGGGVGVESGTFIKADSGGDSGIIYGSGEGANSNTSDTGQGHAAYVYDASNPKKRDATANAGDNMNSSDTTGWE
jgi:hypothetical protein